jgi:hypothetical protein
MCQSVSHFDHNQAQTKCKYKRKTATEEAWTWETVKCGVPQEPVPGQLLCHIYINDLPGSIDNSSNMTMYATDTSIFTANNCYEDLDSNSNTVLYNPSNGFRPASQMALNMEKTKTVKFTASNCSYFPLHIYLLKQMP